MCMGSSNDAIKENFRDFIDSGKIDPLIGDVLKHIKRAMGSLVLKLGSFNWSGVSFVNGYYAPGAFA